MFSATSQGIVGDRNTEHSLVRESWCLKGVNKLLLAFKKGKDASCRDESGKTLWNPSTQMFFSLDSPWLVSSPLSGCGFLWPPHLKLLPSISSPTSLLWFFHNTYHVLAHCILIYRFCLPKLRCKVYKVRVFWLFCPLI